MTDSAAPLPPSMAPAMALALEANFGSLAQWRRAAEALLSKPAQAAGCVDLLFVPSDGSLVLRERTDGGEPEGPVLVVQAWPPGADLAQTDWANAYERYQHAVHAASAACAASAADLAGALLLDVRRAGVYQQAAVRIPGAQWQDPAAVAQWGATLPRSQPVVVYCVYGHEVGRATALRLRGQGVDARFLEGGIDGWQRAGGPVQNKEASS
jgi:Fe-Mn family superoxide dismutase